MKMKRIMLMTNPENADTIGSIPTSLDKIKQHIFKEQGINFGNKLFVTATEQYLTKEDIFYEAIPYQQIYAQEASERFDMVVAPLANIFHITAEENLKQFIAWVKELKIPIFLLGCGIESDSLEELELIRGKIGRLVAQLMDVIYQSGGEIATRGFVTKEFLDRCGNNSAIATGCPSFYRNGVTEFTKRIVKKEDFSVAFVSCDYPEYLLKYHFENYPESMIIDQETYIENYYKNEDLPTRKKVLAMQFQVGWQGMKAFAEGRVYPVSEIPLWLNTLKNYSMAYGSRIHGINAALEAKIPMKIVCKSLRTREMAEYIGLPRSNAYNPKLDLYEEYLTLDLSELNRKYREGYGIFEKFMRDHHITENISDHSFWDQKQKEQLFQQSIVWPDEELEMYRKEISKVSYPLYYAFYDLKRRVATKLY